jgi:hypothetical protein
LKIYLGTWFEDLEGKERGCHLNDMKYRNIIVSYAFFHTREKTTDEELRNFVTTGKYKTIAKERKKNENNENK